MGCNPTSILVLPVILWKTKASIPVPDFVVSTHFRFILVGWSKAISTLRFSRNRGFGMHSGLQKLSFENSPTHALRISARIPDGGVRLRIAENRKGDFRHRMNLSKPGEANPGRYAKDRFLQPSRHPAAMKHAIFRLPEISADRVLVHFREPESPPPAASARVNPSPI